MEKMIKKTKRQMSFITPRENQTAQSCIDYHKQSNNLDLLKYDYHDLTKNKLAKIDLNNI